MDIYTDVTIFQRKIEFFFTWFGKITISKTRIGTELDNFKMDIEKDIDKVLGN